MTHDKRPSDTGGMEQREADRVTDLSPSATRMERTGLLLRGDALHGDALSSAGVRLRESW
jgi:hypothetical protein